MDNNYILVKTICHHYEISEKMVEQLHEFDFIQFYMENDEEYMDGQQLSKLEQILNGDLDELIDALITADTAEKMKAGAEEL
mgnify:CR=1 FL=1